MSVISYIKDKKRKFILPLLGAGIIKILEIIVDLIAGDGDGHISQLIAKSILKYLYLLSFAAAFLIWFIAKFKNKTKNEMIFEGIFSIILITFTFFLTEFAVYILLCFSINIVPGSPKTTSNYTAISKPMAYFNKATGYKWKSGSARVMRILNNELIYDYKFTMNNVGYHSSRDYNFKKDSGIYRVMVMGDSFTNELFEDPWIDAIQKRTDSLGLKIEWYAFTSDGGGLFNWHEIFFNEIVPAYDFDAVIISSFIDNLNRGYSIFDSGNNKQFNFSRFNSVPTDTSDYRKNYIPKMGPVMFVLGESGMDSVKNAMNNKKPKLIKWNFYLSHFIYETYLKSPEEVSEIHKLNNSYSLKDIQKLKADEIFDKMKKRYPAGHMAMLGKIINWCKSNNKKIILSPVPKKEILAEYLKSGQDNIYSAELKAVTDVFSIDFFDGYKAFDGIKSETVDAYYLKYDGHWASKGSTQYAYKLADYINDKIKTNGKN